LLILELPAALGFRLQQKILNIGFRLQASDFSKIFQKFFILQALAIDLKIKYFSLLNVISFHFLACSLFFLPED
jgi:hypothetical protein